MVHEGVGLAGLAEVDAGKGFSEQGLSAKKCKRGHPKVGE